ncbi:MULTISPECIES: NAD kinase [Flavobacterium]|uniref:NAD kinase n=1 Tax=Flavobacterium TaxID=237 RepID=UPI00086889D2|nr:MULTISPECIES: NAD kinase [Flavobacterium]MBN9286236.1 NAD kinase [Flavobacterium sp.]ODS85792.1 MAG: NAD kinase [Chryseobacterium sp. SCN 40-13]OJV73854.1 MAG: NAD kinase [Flavobacterium sp. 40-81]
MKLALYGQYYQKNTEEIINKVFDVFKNYETEVVFEANFHTILLEKGILDKAYPTFSNHTQLDSTFDFFISIGGDGTMLRAATFVKSKNIPIVGINAGRLGFLANVQQDAIGNLLPLLFEGNYKISQRALLSLECYPEECNIYDLNFALNEITVSRKDTTSMITIETCLNGEYLTSYWADGLIISTPTGSTGYSLSCGGPVITPDVKCIIITPIAPHNLNVRPLIISDDTAIRLKVSSREPQFLVSLDSGTKAIDNETEIHISKAPFTINMVEFPEEGFLKTLRNKLLWGEDKRN